MSGSWIWSTAARNNDDVLLIEVKTLSFPVFIHCSEKVAKKNIIIIVVSEIKLTILASYFHSFEIQTILK